MKEWTQDKKWSDRFLPEIKRIIGEHLIAEPPVEEDSDRNTDLMVLRLDAIRIACRIRNNKYLADFGDEFTIRSGRPSGVKTELTKIIEGWGNYFFYGFSDENDEKLSKWILCDLNAFRVYLFRNLVKNKGEFPGVAKENIDNSSSFKSFKYREIPGFVIASSFLI